jgi:hypothetical protein
LGEEILSKVVLKEKKRKQDWISDEKQTYGFRITKGMRGFA